jgi:hypothetical protein
MSPKPKKEQTDPHGMFSGMIVFFVAKGVQARRLQVHTINHFYSQKSKPIFYYLIFNSKFSIFFQICFILCCVRFGSRGWCKWVLS